MEVKSPYNFVPAPKESEVLKPDWARQVSHDIPFSDGESGIIEFTIKAQTPIFIRDGHARNETTNEFCHIKDKSGKKQYYIPGTSVKGMIRNVLEIITRSRMQQVDDDRYAFRDLTNGSLYLEELCKSNEVCGGWLFEDEDGKWKIEDCKKPIRIHHSEVDKILGTDFRESFLNREPPNKTARWKYEKINDDDNKLVSTFRIENKNGKKLAFYENAGVKGTIVLTGQSSKRNEKNKKKPSGKVFEFVFLENMNPETFTIDEKQKKDFKFIYLDHDRKNISKDWEFWKDKLKKGKKVPIFFMKDGNKVKHFGLAFMYKLPYKYSIHELTPYKTYTFSELDFAETIFGCTRDEHSLKGRVSFSHCWSVYGEPVGDIKKEILSTPKASYYPFYLNQKNGNKYYTYQDEDAVLRGFKRYPVHNDIKSGRYSDEQKKNENVFSDFIPLNSGAKFQGKIRIHNLRTIEIGALLSAITFHENKGYFHSLGGAKPFGYGRVNVEINNLKGLKHSVRDYLLAFEKYMKSKCEEWPNTKYMHELFCMAKLSKKEEEKKNLVYPNLKEYQKYKGPKKGDPKYYLEAYSTICGEKLCISTIENRIKLEKGDFDFNCKTLKELKTKLKGFCKIPDSRHNELIEVIRHIYKEHRASRRELEKDGKGFSALYKWHTTITNWLGEEKARQLYKELTGKDE